MLRGGWFVVALFALARLTLSLSPAAEVTSSSSTPTLYRSSSMGAESGLWEGTMGALEDELDLFGLIVVAA